MAKNKRNQPGDAAKAVAYLRVSTDEQGNGVEAQRDAIATWAERHGVEVVAVYEDRLSGGKTADTRPALMDALSALRHHGAGVLVAAKRCRIARDVGIAIAVERAVADAGARILTADGVAAEDTPEGRLMRTMLDAFAEYERQMIRLRTRLALRSRRARGLRYTGTAPIGWSFADDGRLVEDAGEREQLERARQMRTRGASFPSIIRFLNASGSLRDGRWHETTLKRALARIGV